MIGHCPPRVVLRGGLGVPYVSCIPCSQTDFVSLLHTDYGETHSFSHNAKQAIAACQQSVFLQSIRSSVMSMQHA